MKKLYLINLQDDVGEVWLNEDGKIIEMVHCNDANFDSYHEFIIEYFDGQLIQENIYLNQKIKQQIFKHWGDYDKILTIVKKISKII